MKIGHIIKGVDHTNQLVMKHKYISDSLLFYLHADLQGNLRIQLNQNLRHKMLSDERLYENR